MVGRAPDPHRRSPGRRGPGDVARGSSRCLGEVQGRRAVNRPSELGPAWPPTLASLHTRGGPMHTLEIGLVLPMCDTFVDGSTARWVEIRDLALQAEEIGFDIVWTADELLWRPADGTPQGWWEGVAMTGAVAAATSRVKIGTWVLSALHRNPGISAKAVETLDEISGGRFVLGLGSGHAGRQAHAFGLPEDHVFSRFEEALEIIVPLLRRGRADLEGAYHAARKLEHRPVEGV